MTPDCYEWPNTLEHPKGAKWATLRPDLAPPQHPVELEVLGPYTRNTGASSALTERDPPEPLERLLQGKPVQIWMETPRPKTGKKTTSTGPVRTPVVVLHGPEFGSRHGLFLIAAVGKASVVADARGDLKKPVADLVLAGIPSHLARALMNQLHRIVRR